MYACMCISAILKAKTSLCWWSMWGPRITVLMWLSRYHSHRVRYSAMFKLRSLQPTLSFRCLHVFLFTSQTFGSEQTVYNQFVCWEMLSIDSYGGSGRSHRGSARWWGRPRQWAESCRLDCWFTAGSAGRVTHGWTLLCSTESIKCIMYVYKNDNNNNGYIAYDFCHQESLNQNKTWGCKWCGIMGIVANCQWKSI